MARGARLIGTMQSASWYLRRLRRMSAAEVRWRGRAAVRDLSDSCRLAFGVRPAIRVTGAAADVRLCDVPVGAWAQSPDNSREGAWRRALTDAADALAAHRFTFFNLRNHHLGDPIDWNRDHETDKATPLRAAPLLDYRDPAVAGDAKVVWEPNRHHQLVVLGRAYRATGRVEYARAVVEQLDSWIEQCPFGRGMNWRSPLELSIRLINWIWALDLIRPSGVLSGGLAVRVRESMYLHLWDLTRKYSRGSSANNHRLGEAAGVFIATTCVPDLASESRWRPSAREILVEETFAQSYADGGSREQALSYQLFVLQFLLLAVHAARRTGETFPPEVVARVERLLEYVNVLAQAGPPPAYGDSDDGYVVDLGGRAAAAAVLAAGGALLNRPDLALADTQSLEPAYWLLGPNLDDFDKSIAGSTPRARPLISQAFPETGLYLLQSGQRGSDEALSVCVDVAELGFGSLAAHGHADALSFTVRAFGTDVIVDPGTYDYFSDPRWRDYFRSTRAHNTIAVDGADQSVMLGPFMWGARASSRLIEWSPSENGGRLVAEHDGYSRLRDPLIHRRTLLLDHGARRLDIRDDLACGGPHDVEIYLHLSETCRVLSHRDGRIEVGVGARRFTVDLDPGTTSRVLHGSMDPVGGWVSRAYHSRSPAPTIVAATAIRGASNFSWSLTF